MSSFDLDFACFLESYIERFIKEFNLEIFDEDSKVYTNTRSSLKKEFNYTLIPNKNINIKDYTINIPYFNDRDETFKNLSLVLSPLEVKGILASKLSLIHI